MDLSILIAGILAGFSLGLAIGRWSKRREARVLRCNLAADIAGFERSLKDAMLRVDRFRDEIRERRPIPPPSPPPIRFKD